MELRNDTQKGDKASHQLDAAAHYQIVAAPSFAEPPPPAWLQYPYRWGSSQHLNADNAWAERFIDRLVGKTLVAPATSRDE